MSREFASPELANLIALRLPPEEFNRRLQTPLGEEEAHEIAELITWFTRRYPTVEDRFRYANRKLREYTRVHDRAASTADYLTVAKHLANAHRKADPQTMFVFLNPDPEGKEIRLLEVTGSAPTTGQPWPFGFATRPDLGVPFPIAMLMLSPDEWTAVQDGRLELPDDWNKERLQAL